MNRQHRRRTLVTLLCAATVLAGCAQGSPETDGRATPTSGGTSTPTATSGTTTSGSSASGTSTGTTPDSSQESTGSKVPPPQPSFVDRQIAGMTVREKAGQLLVPVFSGTSAPTSEIRSLDPGGLIYFEENMSSESQTAQLSSDAQDAASKGQPLLLMTDQEGGLVSRVPWIDAPAGEDLGGDRSQAREVAQEMGRELVDSGFNTDMAPDADVNSVGDAGVIGSRAFGSTPGEVSPMVKAQICGFHRGGVATAVKHFPGHGSTSIDSHVETAEVTRSMKEWRSTDLPPFRAAVKAGVDMVMVGHLAFPAIDPSGRPASISKKLNEGLIRRQLHFDGVVVTDALNMGGITRWGSSGEIAVRSVKAGSDLLLMPPDPEAARDALVRAVRSGRLSEARLDASVRRILELKQRLGLYADGTPDFPSC